MRGEPTRESPTRFASRARVSSNFSGSGEEGTNNPCCIARGAAGSAARKICTIGALGGSIPLPASIGTIGGIAGMLIVYGVHHNPAVAAVLLHQAIGLLVPLAGGTIAYLIIRRRLGPLPIGTHRQPGG